MKNIHIIPTNKPSRIYLIKSNNRLGITSNNPEFTENFGSGTQNQNIYTTSDEEIKENTKPCWCLDIKDNSVNYYQGALPLYNYIGYKKILLTTDQDLIKDGVQAIGDGFLEWFVKNPSCEYVEVDLFPKYSNKLYEIIIPKEEPKDVILGYKTSLDAQMLDKVEPKQKTLEEAALNIIPDRSTAGWIDSFSATERIGFIKGANWQAERMYSEEEVINAFNEGQALNVRGKLIQGKEWFEQFKKK